MKNTISGNSFYGQGQSAIYIYASSYNVIEGNMIDYASKGTHNSADSISIHYNGSNYSTYNIIANNNIQASQANKARYHINETAAGCDYNLVIGNICKDGATGQINLQGANSVRGTNIPATG
jgi:parallel beta-helix repeat protein